MENFLFYIVSDDFRSDGAVWIWYTGIGWIAIEEEGVEVLQLTSYGDLTPSSAAQSRASCFILSMMIENLDVTLAQMFGRGGMSKPRLCVVLNVIYDLGKCRSISFIITVRDPVLRA